jgi:hypothetical protein
MCVRRVLLGFKAVNADRNEEYPSERNVSN